MVDSKVKVEFAEEDDIIILDEEGSPKKTRQKVRDFNQLHQLNHDDESTKELCSYHR